MKNQKLPKMNERNEIRWLDVNFVKNYKSYGCEPMWFVKYPRISICALLVVYLNLTVSILSPWRIPKIISLIMALMFIAALYFDVFYNCFYREKKYYKKIFENGGEIIDHFNNRLLGINRKPVVFTFFALYGVMICVYLGVILAKVIHGEAIQGGFGSIYLPVMMVNSLGVFSYSGYFEGPFIFMDLSKGMVFGSPVFPYDALQGFTPTGTGNGFELYHNGKVVAKGRMLPSDSAHLLEILEIQRKYGHLLEKETA